MAHDPPTGGEFIQVRELLELYISCGKLDTLAVNIKSDGLCSKMPAILTEFGGNGFAFDMSTPEAIDYKDRGFDVVARRTDLGLTPASMMRPPAYGWMA
jgi:hypothetical protein